VEVVEVDCTAINQEILADLVVEVDPTLVQEVLEIGWSILALQHHHKEIMVEQEVLDNLKLAVVAEAVPVVAEAVPVALVPLVVEVVEGQEQQTLLLDRQ